MHILQNLKYITYFTEVLPFIFCLFYFKRINTKNTKVFFLYTIIITVLVFAVILTRYIYNSFSGYYLVTRIYNVLEYSILAYLFYLHTKNKIIRHALLYSIVPFLFFCVLNYLNSAKPGIPFLPLVFEYLILLAFIIYFFFEAIQVVVTEPIYHKPIFWVSVGFIINFSGNFFVLLSSIKSFDDVEFRDVFTVIYSSVTILKNILLCISLTVKETSTDNQTIDYLSLDNELDTNLHFKN